MNSLSIKPAAVIKLGSLSWLLRWARELAAEERKRGVCLEKESGTRGKLRNAAWKVLLVASGVKVGLSPLVSSPSRSMLRLIVVGVV